MAKKKYYVVWEGNNPGIYDSWTDCQLQIKGYPNARYKSFKTKEAAESAYSDSPFSHIGLNAEKKQKADRTNLSSEEKAKIIWDSLAVDAACSGNPGIMEYRGVYTKDNTELFRIGPFRKGTNNVGEFLAIVHGLAWLKKQGSTQPIYTDSRTAMAWVRRKKANTKLTREAANASMFKLVDRAVLWLKNNTYTTEIIKWDTKNWGEIPADFGRK